MQEIKNGIDRTHLIYKNPCLCFVRIVIMFFKRVFRGQKICLRYFEICQTYFKLCPTNFSGGPETGFRKAGVV